MADEDKEKAEKVAAAKKRVGSPLKRLLGLRGGGVNSSSSAIENVNSLEVVELDTRLCFEIFANCRYLV